MKDFPYMHLDKTGLAQSKSTKRLCRFIPGFRNVPWPVLWFIALLILSNGILPFHRNTAYAAQNDNNRWSNVTAWKGTVSITRTYQGTDKYGAVGVTIQDSVSGSIDLSGGGEGGFGLWVGYITGSYSVNEQYVHFQTPNPCGDSVVTVTGGGSITHIPGLTVSTLMSFNAGLYDLGLAAFGNVVSTTKNDCFVSLPSNSTLDLSSGSPHLSNIPFPSSGLILSGNKKYYKEALGYYIEYDVTWNLSPADVTPPPPSTEDYPCIEGGCTIAVQNQSLGETVDIVGTPFSLNYQSDRVPGCSGANSLAISHAKSLGGWSLNVHHSYDPDGGGLFLGDGTNRSAADLGSVFQVNSALTGLSIGEYLIAAEDGNEVYVFDSSGKHLRTLDALTKALRYQFTYDSDDRLTTITDGYGNVTTIERDTSGNPTAIVGPYGQRTTLTLNTNGYIEKIANPANESVQLKYTSDGLLTGKTDQNGNTYNFSYDDNGRLIRDSDPAGGLKTLSRSDSEGGYTVTLNTTMGRTTTYQVENVAEGGQRRINTFPGGLKREWLKDKSNGTQTTSLPNGKKVTLALGPDPRWDMQSPIAKSQTISTGGLTSTSEQTRTVTQTNSDDPFSLETLTDSTSINGRTYTYTNIYEADTRTFTDITPAGRQMFTTIDAQGRVVQEQVNGLLPASYNYDERGRLSSATWGTETDTRSFILDYNSDGYLATITDPLGRTFELEYSEAGRMTQQTLPGGLVVRYAYNANNNITAITPDGKPAHTFAYTPVDLQSAYTPPKIGEKTTKTLYEYNTDRQLTSITRPDGKVVKLGYDSAGRLSTLSEAKLSYGYDVATGNLTTITREGDQLIFRYDGALLADETWEGGIAGIVNRTYDNDFRITSNSVNGNNIINFQYDDDGLLTQAGDLILSRNTQNGLITGSTLGNTADTWSYNGFGEPTDYNVSYKGTSIYHIQYVRDKLGRIIIEKTKIVEDETDTYGYTYDLAGRLTKVTKNDTTIASYTYDSNGNRLSLNTITGAYDAQDRLITYGNNSYTDTANGELLTRTDTSTSETTAYTYDVLGNLVSVTLPDGRQIQYIIDGRNRRIGKKVNGTLTQGFLYQGGLRPIAELDNNGNIVSRFIYANRINVPDYLVKGGVTYRIITDHLGSPQLVVDVATGTVAQRMDYDEFGQVLSDTNPGFQPFGFAGGLYDRDTKLVRFGARDYDAETGRWTAKDPILFEGGDLNLYEYVRGDPVNFLDPTGKEWEWPTWEQTTEFVKSTGKNLVKSIKIGGKKAVPLPPVVSTLSGAASEEGAAAQRAVVDILRKKAIDVCLRDTGDPEKAERIRNLPTTEFLTEFAPGWNK